jgi:hypothetical protein
MPYCIVFYATLPLIVQKLAGIQPTKPSAAVKLAEVILDATLIGALMTLPQSV